jgi:hypothetical protein
MKTLLAVVLLLLVVVVAVPMISGTDGEHTDKPIEGLPWQIESLPDGRSRVFGLTLATSTFDDAGGRLGADMKVAVVAAPGEPGLVEAYYEQIAIGPLTGKMILTAAVDPQTVERWSARAAKVEYMESSTRKYTLNAEDLALAQRAPIAAIAFIPTAQLDAETAIQRFGPPAERIRTSEHIEHLLYPAKGLSLTVDGKGRELLQYVAPRQFARLREPLVAAGAR